MWIDDKFDSPGWQGIAVFIATCFSILIAVRWLRDAAIWISENITNTHTKITDEQNNDSIIPITILIKNEQRTFYNCREMTSFPLGNANTTHLPLDS